MNENKQVIGVAQVLEHLKNGMTREEIGTHYGITPGEVKILFKHKDLIGKKTVKKPSFVIVDDETKVEAVVTEVKVEDTVEVTEADIAVYNTVFADVATIEEEEKEEEEYEEEEYEEYEDDSAIKEAEKASWD